jgi:hypothetical protein
MSRRTAAKHTFSVIVDGETIRDRMDPREGPIRLNPWAGYIEIRDAASDTVVATLPMMDLADLEEGPWTTPVDLPWGGRMILTVSASPSESEDALPELSLVVRQEANRSGASEARARAPWFSPRMRLPLAAAATVLALLVAFRAGSAVRRYTELLTLYETVVRQLGLDEPFSVHFSVVGQQRLQLDLSVNRDIIREVFVEWGDPANPDPAGGTRVFPRAGLPEVDGLLRIPALVHDYPRAGAEGLRTEARVRLVPVEVPVVAPETLSPEKLNPSKRLWILPYGIVLDPPPAVLRIVSPKPGEVVPARSEVRLEMEAITGTVHLLAFDQADPTTYHLLESTPVPRPGERSDVTLVVGTTRVGREGPFRLLVVSTDRIEAAAGTTIPSHAIPETAPRDDLELRHAGVILAPSSGSVVAGIGTVRARVLLPGRHAVVAVRPQREGRYWIQNDPLAATEFVEISVQVFYGGRDDYEIWLGVTEDPDAFKLGDQIEQLREMDAQGRPVYWVGPVDVRQP